MSNKQATTEGNKMNAQPVIATVHDDEGNYAAIRFPSAAAVQEWEDRTGVEVLQVLPTTTRAKAVKMYRA